ncbi:sugar ABC transporter ATP-binding protein [Starkeya sp. ORNL1]|uniref:sugar ABC transporter ATP-binding protein n=1 Tax=Starkeya sp. ORNL1 TaxID=2709380 RepID=UPI00146411B2|nr:sugar ABC transporter ATP-binding protein [Starkeya sp. ORNL1]QJP14218.1 sugar ABC transporter ATP-binding protein [Starkeya sp. ORNL1]
MDDGTNFLELIDVTKRYGGVTALKDVCFGARRGSIHAILGENGAGKSTLMKILAGVVRADTGTMRLDGRALDLAGPADALDAGVVCIFQELSIIPDLTVAENICLASPPRRRFGLIDKRAQLRAARAVLAEIGCADAIDVRGRCAELPLSKRQLVEIAKAVVRRPRVLILDEATSALTAEDAGKVMALLRRLREDGCCVLFISHRMHEVDALADTCSVFRNGEHVATFPAGAKSHDEIVRLMIGRPIAQVYPPKPARSMTGDAYLAVADLGWAPTLDAVTLGIRPGEIVGLGGLDGQGQRELLLALAGVLRGSEGMVRFGAKGGLPAGPRFAKQPSYRTALIPEDRKTEGLFLGLSVRANLGIAALDRLSRGGVIDPVAEQALIERLVKTLQIKAPDVDAAVGTLSGGNQQKVVLAKWLATEPRLLLLMDPTRGIDVGTKQEIYRLFRDLAASGVAILLYSTDYDELIGLCDQVLVMYGGRIVARLDGPTLTEENLVASALNLRPQPAQPHASFLEAVA